MIIHAEIKFSVPMNSPEEKLAMEEYLKNKSKDQLISEITADIYEVFKDELIEATGLEITVAIDELKKTAAYF